MEKTKQEEGKEKEINVEKIPIQEKLNEKCQYKKD